MTEEESEVVQEVVNLICDNDEKLTEFVEIMWNEVKAFFDE